jgi:uncharacterized repeat protein (TIGR03803 family)
MPIARFRTSAIVLLSLLGSGRSVPAAPQANARVISTLPGYGGAGPLAERFPGLFFDTIQVLATGSQVAFSISTSGAMTTLATWPSGYNFRYSAFVIGPNGRGYGEIQQSDNPATAFSVTPQPGALKVYPAQNYAWGLTQGLPGGTFLAAAIATGLGANDWYVATMDSGGTLETVYQFPLSYQPIGGPIYASDGNYYGITANEAGADSYLFSLTPGGVLTKVFNYPSNTFKGAGFSVPVLQASDGNFYSSIQNGGANGTGIIYRITSGGQYTALYTFPPGKKNSGPSVLIEGSDGNIYGATAPPGVIFRLSLSGQYQVVYTPGGAVGSCYCSLLQGSNGNIYGTTGAGGKNGGGTIFALDLGLPKPAPQAPQFTPISGAAGTQVLIWGNNLLSPSVSFNGTPAASVTSSGPNYIRATVPSGATTGPITVTTPGGTYTTLTSFTVQ